MASSTWSFLIYPSVRQLSCHCWAVNLLTLKIAAKLHNLQVTIKMYFFFFFLNYIITTSFVMYYLFIEHCMRYLRGLSRSTRIHTSFSLFMSESGVCRITMALCGRFSPHSTVGSRTTYDPFSMWVTSPSLVFKHTANVLLQEEFRGWGGWRGVSRRSGMVLMSCFVGPLTTRLMQYFKNVFFLFFLEDIHKDAFVVLENSQLSFRGCSCWN